MSSLSENESERSQLQRANFFSNPFRWIFNVIRNFFTSQESTDGRNSKSRLFHHLTHRLRKFFSRNRKIHPLKEFPRLSLPPIALESEYAMNYKSRGLAVIFNHKHFDKHMGFHAREGTEMDVDKLVETCQKLEFDVQTHNDMTRKQIFTKLEEISSLDHSNSDCILIAILTHGERGQIFSSDDAYDIAHVTSFFDDETCPSLSGKPKMFFIQSCRGKNFDLGYTMAYSLEYQLQRQNLRGGLERVDVSTFEEIPVELREPEMVHNPPNHPDFLIVRSTMPDYVSFRNITKGSWFIQSLCEELIDHGDTTDILTLLTWANLRVAEKESEPRKFKQILCISTMLRKKLILHKKTVTNDNQRSNKI